MSDVHNKHLEHMPIACCSSSDNRETTLNNPPKPGESLEEQVNAITFHRNTPKPGKGLEEQIKAITFHRKLQLVTRSSLRYLLRTCPSSSNNYILQLKFNRPSSGFLLQTPLT